MKNQIVNRGTLFSLAAVLMMLFALHGTTYGQTAISIDPAQIESPAVGEQISVSINISGGANVAGYELVLTYDSSALSLTAFANADYLQGNPFVTGPTPAVADAQGEVKLAVASIGAASDGDGTLATATFAVVEVKDSSIGLTSILSDAAAAAITHTTAGSAVSVPTTDDGTTDDGTTDDGTTDDGTTDDGTTDDGTTDDGTTDDGTTDDGTTDDGTTDDGTTDDGTTDDGTTDDGTTDDGTTDDGTTDDGTTDDGTTDDGTTDDGTTDDGTTDDGTTDDGTTDDGTTDDGTTDDGTTDDGTTDDGTTDDGTTDDGTTDDGTTDDGTTDDGTTDDGTTDDGTTDDGTTDDGTTDDGTTDDGTTDDGTTDDGTTDDGTTDDGTTDDGTTDDGTTDDGTTDDGTTDDGTMDDGTTDDGTMDDGTTDDDTTDEMPMPSFSMMLDKGLNMISLPLMPTEAFTAQSLADAVGATVVIKLDAMSQKFIGFTVGDEGGGFAIEGGKGYIVNTPAGGSVTFTGTAWDNQQVASAPGIGSFKNAWAFVVNGSLQNADPHTNYTLVAKNLRTGAVATEPISTAKTRSSAVWADLNRNSVIEAGDRLEVTVLDDSGNIVSGPFTHTVDIADIRQAYLRLSLVVGDVHPEQTRLAQNFPNPFNPETWMPFQLSESSFASIKIYSATGHLVRTLDLGMKPAGFYMTRSTAVYWDGRNDVGEHVATGVYFYTLKTDSFAATRKMLISK